VIALTDDLTLRNKLLDATKEGRFLEVVYDGLRSEDVDIERLSDEIIKLHNGGQINVVAEFGTLRNSGLRGPDFFLTRHVFEKALAHLEARVETVLPCVVTLCKEAGQDMAAGTIFNEYVDFCTRVPARPKEALKLIEKNPADFGLALSATIDAGSRHDWDFFVAETIRLMCHEDVELRTRSTFALHRIASSGRGAIPQEAVDVLSFRIDKEQHDLALGGAIKAAIALQRAGVVEVDDAVAMAGKALGKGGEQSLHVASELLWLDQTEIPAPLLNLLLLHLKRVDPKNLGTLRNIDYGVAQLIKGNNVDVGLNFIEGLLVEHSGQLCITNFDSTKHATLADESILGRVVTRWFVKQEPALWQAVGDIVSSSHGEPLRISVDPSEFPTVDFVHLLFIARKGVGFFFIKAVSAASFVVSLMRIAPDEETLRELSKLLYDPLLMNYPGGVQKYLTTQALEESDLVRKAIEDALAAMRQYLEVLHSVPELPALFPSRSQREAYHRRMSTEVAESMRAGERNSPFLGMFSRSVLLYGNKSIAHIHVDEGEPKRMEIPLHSHSVEIEFPRIENIDPFGLNFDLRVLRAERFCE